MRFNLKHVFALITLVAFTICVVPTFFTKTVEVRIDSVTQIKGESQPKSDYIMTFESNADGQVTSCALYCSFGHNELLNKKIDIDNVGMIGPQTIEYSYSTTTLPSMKRVSFVDAVKNEFNELIFLPSREELRRSFQTRF